MSMALMLMMIALTGTESASSVISAFTPGENPGEYRVDTGLLRGTLGNGGLFLGPHSLEQMPEAITGTYPLGLLNYYRIFTTDHRYGESMRALIAETRIEDTGALRVHWPAGEGRPFALTGYYQWVAPDTLELETVVTAVETLPEFDVFLASYLSPSFPVSTVAVRQEEKEVAFVNAELEDGVWHCFPRDAAAITLVRDGRWAIPPSPVDWAMRPFFTAPLIFRRNEETGLVVAMMAQPQDCFALFCSYRGEGHYSMYFSLFGRTVEAGETVRNRVRLVVANMDNAEVLERHRLFMEQP